MPLLDSFSITPDWYLRLERISSSFEKQTNNFHQHQGLNCFLWFCFKLQVSGTECLGIYSQNCPRFTPHIVPHASDRLLNVTAPQFSALAAHCSFLESFFFKKKKQTWFLDFTTEMFQFNCSRLGSGIKIKKVLARWA